MNKTDSIPSFWSHCANVKIKTDEQPWCHTATVFGMGSGFICAAGSRSARDKPQAFLSCQSLPSFLTPQQKRKEKKKSSTREGERKRDTYGKFLDEAKTESAPFPVARDGGEEPGFCFCFVFFSYPD